MLTVNNLKVFLETEDLPIQAINTVSFTIKKGETLALVGESGCGKSMIALAIMRLLPKVARIDSNSEIYLENTDILNLSELQMQKIRQNDIAMISQDPHAALNPVLTIGDQLIESIVGNFSYASKKAKVIELMKDVQLTSPERQFLQYPHELSGGMKQRVMIAMALAKAPKILIADEPTTALDVTTQAQILHLLQELKRKNNMTLLLITHDLGVVKQMADNVAVMYAGHIVEIDNSIDFFKAPKHPYSRKLFQSLPERFKNRNALSVIPGMVPTLNKTFSLCRFLGRCEAEKPECRLTPPEMIKINTEKTGYVRCHWYNNINNINNIIINIDEHLNQNNSEKEIILENNNNNTINNNHDYHHYPEFIDEATTLLTVNQLRVYFPIKKGFFKKTVDYVHAVDGVSFSLCEGETLALVGESGCGKTTVGKAILQLVPSISGNVVYINTDLMKLSPWKMKKIRSDCQIIFQDPYLSMDPRMRVMQILEEGMIALGVGSNAKEREERIDVLLEQVGLMPDIKMRYSHELSGGQRQRICIARVLALGAKLIICDEPTSALDMSVQAQLLNLLQQLQNEFGIAFLFITHNLGIVSYMADNVAVMYLGRIVEYGPRKAIFDSPKHPYTQALLASVPLLDSPIKSGRVPSSVISGEIASNIHPPKGCHFAARCPHVMPKCYEKYPPAYNIQSRQVKCFLYAPEDF